MRFLKFTLLPLLINLLMRTLRFRFENYPRSFEKKIFIFWHSKMLGGWFIFRDKNPIALVSLSEDGEILNRLLMKWNYKVIRGSSSKNSKEALAEIIERAKEGNPAILTPDGPRGPTNEIKNGALIISKENDLPIIPVSINYSSKKILSKSWDNFEIPFPFSKCEVKFGNDIYYKEFLEENELRIFKETISKEMS
jgi:lysophospholipid acyltransferase (LPLAT)-like uncharacterized protein